MQSMNQIRQILGRGCVFRCVWTPRFGSLSTMLPYPLEKIYQLFLRANKCTRRETD